MTVALPSAWLHRDALLRLLAPWETLALFTDVDGTISPIVSTPGDARVITGCQDALRCLAGRLPVVGAVSGRPAALAQTMVGVDGMLYVGNHGLERELGASPLIGPLSSQVLREIQEAVARRSGVVVEDKGSVVAVHYRLAPNQEETRSWVLSLAQTIATRYGLRVGEGRRLVELRPAINVHKGTAVRAILDGRPAVRSALYLGDDRTDADAFAALHRWAEERGGVAIAIAVLSVEAPPELLEGANFALQGVDEVERFLTWLAAAASATE